MSASLTVTDRAMLLQEGFDGTLAKPFDIRQLTETIEQVLGVLV